MSALATIHVGLKQLGIDQDDARDLYERQTGLRSLRDMSPRQHEAVIGELARLGFKRTSNGARKRLEGRFAGKLQALWIAAWNLGLVRDRSDNALVAFVKRQTKIDHVRFLRDADDARKAIEALKGWLEREAGVAWKPGKHAPDWQKTDGFRVAWAQYRILVPGATSMGNGRQFGEEVSRITGRSLTDMTSRDWHSVMNAFGIRVRALRDKAG